MIWPFAMTVALGVMLAQPGAWPVQKIRVWSVLFGSWVAGAIAVALTGNPSPVLAFLTIDVIAALWVLRRPRGVAQNLIGCFYVAMIALHVGYVWAASDILGSVGFANLQKYLFLQTVLGWLQWVVLMLWSVEDVGKAIGIRLGIMGDAKVNQVNIGAGKR